MVISYVFYALNLQHDIEWHGDDNRFYIRTLDEEEFLIKSISINHTVKDITVI